MRTYTQTVEALQYEHGKTKFPNLRYYCDQLILAYAKGDCGEPISEGDYIVKASDDTISIIKKDYFEKNFKEVIDWSKCTCKMMCDACGIILAYTENPICSIHDHVEKPKGLPLYEEMETL